MLKQTVSYEDYDGNPSTETLYFNLTRVEIMDILDLQPRMEAWQEKTAGEDRQLTIEETKELLDIVKILIEKSYGERRENGKKFAKEDDNGRPLFHQFKQTAVYDAFVFGLFEEAGKAVNFMINIFPKSLVEGAQSELASVGAEVVELPSGNLQKSYTEQELMDMSQDEFEKIVGRDPKNMTKEQLAIAFKRKNQTEG